MVTIKQFEQVLVEKYPNGRITKERYIEHQTILTLYYTNVTGSKFPFHVGTYDHSAKSAWWFGADSKAVHVVSQKGAN